MTCLIAIDPGLQSGVAFFEAGQLLDAYEAKPDRAGEIIRRNNFYINGISQVTVAIESQFLGEGKSKKSIFTLIEIAGYWRLLAESYGMMTMRVNPKSWQKSLLVRGQGNARRAQLKRLSREYAVAIWGERAKEWSDNVTDACHIGRWALAELALKGRKI